MAKTVVLKDVPANRVKQVMEDYEKLGAKASKKSQGNGKFTVTAVWPETVA